MFFRLTAPVASLLRSRPQPAPETPESEKTVPELLAALADLRARKVDLERQERDLVAATRARLAQAQEALEVLKRKVFDSGIEVRADAPRPAAPAEAPVPAQSHTVVLSN